MFQLTEDDLMSIQAELTILKSHIESIEGNLSSLKETLKMLEEKLGRDKRNYR